MVVLVHHPVDRRVVQRNVERRVGKVVQDEQRDKRAKSVQSRCFVVLPHHVPRRRTRVVAVRQQVVHKDKRDAPAERNALGESRIKNQNVLRRDTRGKRMQRGSSYRG